MNKKKILIIEDDQDISRTLELFIGSLGFEAKSAFDGREGLEQLKIFKPNLIILDLGLPCLPGEEVCKEIRKDEEYGDIPIIMATAKSSDADRIVGRVIGADYYINKPFEFDVLEKVIKILIEKKRKNGD